MIWYNNIDAVNAIRLGIHEDLVGSRRGRRSRRARGLRLVGPGDHQLPYHGLR